MRKIVLFDGDCLLCQSSVQFIIKRDPKALFQFASLHSAIGKDLCRTYHIPEHIDSIILIENGHAFLKSTAVLRISKHLAGPWKLAYCFILIPRFIRHFIYDQLAKHRQRLIKEEQACSIAKDHLADRLLK